MWATSNSWRLESYLGLCALKCFYIENYYIENTVHKNYLTVLNIILNIMVTPESICEQYFLNNLSYSLLLPALI